MKNISIAIDGPAGAGKSSISKCVAKNLNFIYIDTGAMYRASALFAIINNIPIKEENLIPILDKINIDICYEDDRQIIILNGEDVSERIRQPDASKGSSEIATIPAVRLKLVELQRKLADKRSVIMDGRDIGTYVLPKADIKIYLTASIEERANRRYKEQIEKGMKCEIENVKDEMQKRDFNDSHRKFAPLRKAEDAILVDSSFMTFEEVVEKITTIIREKINLEMEEQDVL